MSVVVVAMRRRQTSFLGDWSSDVCSSDLSGMPSNALPWSRSVPEERAIRGIIGVDLESGNPPGTRAVLTQILGFREVERSEERRVDKTCTFRAPGIGDSGSVTEIVSRTWQ